MSNKSLSILPHHSMRRSEVNVENYIVSHAAAFTPPFWQAVFALLGLVIALLGLVIAYTVARFHMRNKQVDMIVYHNKQFDELQKKRAEIRIEESAAKASTDGRGWTQDRLRLEADMFFDRFWSLQFDGFIAWYDGYIPTTLYTYWLFARWRELSEASAEWTLDQQTLRSSLEIVRKKWATNPDPRSSQTVQAGRFLNLMLDLSTGRMVDIERLLRRNGPSATTRITRKVFGAY